MILVYHDLIKRERNESSKRISLYGQLIKAVPSRLAGQSRCVYLRPVCGPNSYYRFVALPTLLCH